MINRCYPIVLSTLESATAQEFLTSVVERLWTAPITCNAHVTNRCFSNMKWVLELVLLASHRLLLHFSFFHIQMPLIICDENSTSNNLATMARTCSDQDDSLANTPMIARIRINWWHGQWWWSATSELDNLLI